MFKENVTFKPEPLKTASSVNEEIVIKYSKLDRELNGFSTKTPDVSVLQEIIKVRKLSAPPPPPPSPKPKAKPKSVVKTPKRNWDLKYIIITDTNKIAFLNGKTVKTGDIINGAEIIDIKSECIKLKTEKGSRCIYLNH